MNSFSYSLKIHLLFSLTTPSVFMEKSLKFPWFFNALCWKLLQCSWKIWKCNAFLLSDSFIFHGKIIDRYFPWLFNAFFQRTPSVSWKFQWFFYQLLLRFGGENHRNPTCGEGVSNFFDQKKKVVSHSTTPLTHGLLKTNQL